MSRTLIGSSNVARFNTVEKFKNYKPYVMLKTCNLEVFKTRVGLLEQSDKFVIIQIMENLFEDAVKSNVGEDGKILENVLINTVKATVTVVSNLVKDVATRMPESRFAVISPILRPGLDWYTQRFDDVERIFTENMNDGGLVNVRQIRCFAREAQTFEADYLHLTKESGEIFVESILIAAEKFFAEPLPSTAEEETDMDTEQDQTGSQIGIEIKQSTSGQIPTEPSEAETGSKRERIIALEKRMTNLEQKSLADNLVFARNREDLDYISNEKKEDRIIITGLTNSIPMPNDEREKKLWLEKMVTDILCKLDPEGQGQVLFIKPGKRDANNIPMVEVRLENREMAKRIRSCYAEKKKNNVDLGKLFVANCVTLATRVRIDIMRAIATKNYNKGILELYVAPFSSRPVLHVKEVDKAPYALTFADAITRYKNTLSEEDLGEAYRRVGRSYEKQLSQIFVVLKEDPSRRFETRVAKRGFVAGGRGRGQDRGRGGQTRGYARGRGAGRGQKRNAEDQGQTKNRNTGGKSTGYGVAKRANHD